LAAIVEGAPAAADANGADYSRVNPEGAKFAASAAEAALILRRMWHG